MIRPRSLRALIATTAVSCALVAPSPAHAGVTTYWPSVSNTACNGSTVGSVSSGGTKRRGNWGYNRVWSQIYVNGGSWWWGAYYIGGGSKMVNNNQAGAWNSITSIDGGQQSDPFMSNGNGVTVAGSGCFYW